LLFTVFDIDIAIDIVIAIEIEIEIEKPHRQEISRLWGFSLITKY